jgi:hypothetical protein
MAVDDALEITVLQLPKFKAEATKLIGEDGIDALAVYLIDHPAGGDVIPGTGGARKLRWAAKEGFAANRGQSERSAIECPRKRLRRRQPLERT